MLRRIARILAIGIAVIAALVGAYFGSAFALSRWTVNDDFAPVPDGIPIGLSNNGIHANLHLPVNANGTDWTQLFPPKDFPAVPWQPATVAFGWGSREFYLNVPTWDDLTLGVALTALSGTGGTALHVSYWAPWPEGEDYVEVRISPEAYDVLVDHVMAAIRPGPDGRPQRIAGYSYLGNDGFYESHGAYSMFVTCNEWVRRGLAAAGIRTGVWSPFPDPLLAHLRD
ncbi:MAG: TIGR02117 family protein [Alphaproteobacteria bacterium]